MTTKRTAWAILPLALCLALWWILSFLNHARVIPTPPETARALLEILRQSDSWMTLLATLLRGVLGLAAGGALAIATGIYCGRHPRLHDAVTPVITLVQSCPPIVWISLLLVWLSIGGTVPLVVVFLSVFPVLFVNTATATRSLDPRWFELARVYRFSPWRRLRGIILPGISQGLAAGFSYALGITWKVTATAEFFGAQDGIGAKIYSCYREMALPQLFAWTLLIALIGVVIEALLIKRFRSLSR